VLRVDGFFSPEIFSNDGIRNMDLEKMLVNQRMQKDLLMADWVVYQSNFSKSMADKYLYDRKFKYSIIHNGVDTQHFCPSENVDDAILMLGAWRDVDLVTGSLSVFKLIKMQSEFSKTKLRIIGSFTDEVETAVQCWLKENESLVPYIDVLGALSFEELPHEIKRNKVSMHLKFGDWCPNAVLETLACGVPVVCPTFGGTAELVGKAGLLIDAPCFVYDEDYFSKCADALTTALQRNKELRLRARERAVQFDNEIVMKKYMDILLSE